MLRCGMDHDCTNPVTHIDNKGYAYCSIHGPQRRFFVPCRKLRPWELHRLERGETLKSY